MKTDFKIKGRWVINGHKNLYPIGSNYEGVVSRENIQVDLTYAYLNDVDVLKGDYECWH